MYKIPEDDVGKIETRSCIEELYVEIHIRS
jgi:hypothetical protein